MISTVKKIKKIYSLLKRISALESELKNIDEKLSKSMDNHLKQFEQKIQNMTFAYTCNLDDAKIDYLKRYLDARLDVLKELVYSQAP